MKTYYLGTIGLICILAINSCINRPEYPKDIEGNGCCSSTGPIQIYKTKVDYSDKVSIKLSEDKSQVLAYPGVGDVTNQYPIELANGYLLKRMVGNAFLSITIDDYQKLTQTPDSDELLEMVIDDEPFTEFYECCKLCLMDTAEINALILDDRLCDCDSVGWWIFN